MPRPRPKIRTYLGQVIVLARGERTIADIAAERHIDASTFSRAELGKGAPSYDTAAKLAAWLGWTTDQVMAAAKKAVEKP